MKWIVAVVVATLAAVANAQPKGPAPGSKQAIVEANKHFKLGQEFYALAKEKKDPKIFDDAIKELEEAYLLSLNADVIYEIAQIHREAGNEDKALETYHRYLDRKQDGERADAARRFVAELTVNKERRAEEARRHAEEEARRRLEDEARRRAEEAAAEQRRRDDEIRRKQDEERRAREAEEQKRREAEALKQAEIDRKRHEQEAVRDAWNVQRAVRKKKRASGYKFLAAGAGCFGASVIAVVLGNNAYASVKNGGNATAGDISSAITTGNVLNGVAVGFAVPGAVLTAIGVPRVVANLDKGEYKLVPVAGGGMTGLVFAGPLP